MPDLFGRPDDAPALTPAERKRMQRRAAERPRGHFFSPGTGPVDETCGSCRHLVRVQHAKTYLKCGKNRANWTGGPASDVRAGDVACSGWERPDA